MEPEGSLPYSQDPATCPYPASDQTSPCPIPLLEDTFNIIPPSTPRFSKWSLSVRLPHQSPICTSPQHLLRASLCSLLHPLLSLFGPNISLNVLLSNILSLCSSLNVRDQGRRVLRWCKIRLANCNPQQGNIIR